LTDTAVNAANPRAPRSNTRTPTRSTNIVSRKAPAMEVDESACTPGNYIVDDSSP